MIDYIRQQLESMNELAKRIEAEQKNSLPAEGSFRDYVRNNVYYIEEYRWGVYEVIVKCPLDEALGARLEAFVEQSPVATAILNGDDLTQKRSPADAWPWPTPTTPSQQLELPIEEGTKEEPMEAPVLPHQPWPFPERTVEEDPFAAYKKAMEVLRGRN